MGKRSKLKKVSDGDNCFKVMNKKVKFDETDTVCTTETATTGASEKTQRQENKSQRIVNKSEINNKRTLVDGDGLLKDESTEHSTEGKRTDHVNDEEDVKDEDIDKFCDELSQEDNEQYESWVKLIEAKLHSNGKKPK